MLLTTFIFVVIQKITGELLMEIPETWKIIALWAGVRGGAKIVEIFTLMEGALAELVRVRSSVTAGNMIALTMQLAEKINYVERRLMAMGESQSDWWRSLSQDVLEVPWVSVRAGSKTFRQKIIELAAVKLQKMHTQTETPRDLIEE